MKPIVKMDVAKPERPRSLHWEPITDPRSGIITLLNGSEFVESEGRLSRKFITRFADLKFKWVGTLVELAEDYYQELLYQSGMVSIATQARNSIIEWMGQLQEGDVVYEYITDEGLFKNASSEGHGGFVALRGDRIVALRVIYTA